MKKKLGLAGILLVTANVAYGQVGINTPNPQSTLDITAKNAKGNTKAPEGLLIPRVDRQRAQSMDGVIPSTMIYVDDIATGSATGSAINIDATGFYFYEGNTWVKMKPESTAALYDADGALKSNRTVAHGTHKLAFTATETNAFSVDGNTFSVDAANNRVGIGTSTPAINLAIPAAEMTGNAVTPEGILIPRVTRLRAQSMQNIPLSTLLFVNSIDTGTQTGNAIHIDAPGYYYFDGNVWVKMLNQNDKEGNIYDEDGILSSNRTIDQTNKNLAFKATETNAFSVDGSTLSVDAKNDRIGVGTAAPTHKLHVAGSVKIADGTQGNNRVLTSDANGAATWKDLPADINTNLYTDNGILTANRTIAQTNKTLAFTGTATNAFSVDGTTLSVDAANDRIGVGTAAPTHKLHVAGSVKIADGTQANNRVLTSDANGAATWKDLPTDKNTNLYTDNGTLTANRTIAQTDKTLAFTGTATNAFSVDGNTFSVDAKNDRIGLGIATPMGKLDMVADNKTVSTDKEVFLRGYGTSKSPILYISSANGTAAAPTNLVNNEDIGSISFTPRANNNFAWGSGTGIIAKYKGNGTTNLTDLSLKTSGTDRMKIDENGNIGIGTTLPKAKVDVVGNGAILGVRNAENLGSWDNLWLKADGASPSINVSGAEKGLQFNVGNNAKGTYGDADQDLTTVATMLPNGNIGIGTDAPTHKLHVEGNVKIIDGTQGNNKVLTSDANGAATWKDLPADKNTNLYTDNGILTANRTIAQTNKTLAFTGTATNAFSVDGTTLSVDAANDRIGVGTAAPTHKLHVAGSVKIADGTQGNNRVLTSDANGAASWKDLPTDKNTNLYTDNGTLTANRTIAQTDKTLAFTGTATNAFSVDGNTFSVDAKNDRIGLGIATPMGKLDMVADNKTLSTDKEVFLRGYGTSKSPKIYISSANGTAAAPTNLAYNDDIGGLDFTPHAGNIFPWGNGSAISAKYKGNGTTRLTDLSLKTSGTERLKIDENGSIGIGTSTPATKLDIMTGTKQYGLQHSDGTINLRTYLGKGVSNGQTDAAWIGTQSNHPLDLMTNDVVKVRIAANGNMGIGTSAPTHKLDVAGSVKIADGTQGNNKVLTSDANGAATWQDLPTDKNTNIYTDNGTLTANRTIAQADKTLAFTGTATNAFSVDGNTLSVDAANDRIGLGTTAPMGKLDMVADNKTVSTDKEVFLRGYGTSKSPILYISSANGTAAAPTNLVNNEDIGSISFTPRANNNFAWGTGTGISAKYKGNGTTNLTDLSLKTSGTDRMKIDENGNVGIGTSTPDSKLHVAGKVKIADGTQGAGKVLTSDANGVATWQATSTSGKWVLDEIYEEVRTRPLTGYPSRNGVTDLDLTQRVYVTIPAYSKAKVNLYYNVPVTFQNSSNLAHYGYVGAKVKKENVDIPKSARRVIIPSIYSNSNPVVLFTSNSFVDEVTNNTATPMYIRYRAYGVVDITTVGSGGGIPVFYFGNQNNAGESIIKAEVYTKPL